MSDGEVVAGAAGAAGAVGLSSAGAALAALWNRIDITKLTQHSANLGTLTR